MRGVVFAIVVGSLSGCRLFSQTVSTQSSFSDTFELADSKSVISDAVSDTEDLLKQNLILKEQVHSLSDAIVVAKSESDAATTESHELKARIEALGVNAIGNDRSKLEQRLIKAVTDLNVAQADLVTHKKVLASLTEAIVSLLKTTKDISPQERLAMETELRSTSQTVGFAPQSAEKAESSVVSVNDARVISLKPEIGLVVGNVGAQDSVKVGMPFRVYDGQNPIALVRVVDVREKLFGALIQETLSDTIPVKVGQRLKVAAN